MTTKKKPAAGQASGQGSNTAKNNNKSHLKNQQVFPYYKGFNETSPIKKLSLSGLELLLETPRTGPKDRTLPLMTPFDGDGKTKKVAQVSQYYAVVIDHDEDDKDKANIMEIYDSYDMAYCAWTTSSHKQPGKGNRWKVLIPFYKPCDHDTWNEISQGTVLLLGTCKAQAGTTQGFHPPNKLTLDAPYEYINELDRPFFEPGDNFHDFNNDCSNAYAQEQQKREQQAAAAIPTPRQVNGSDGNIIEKINQAFHMGEVLTGAGYRHKRKNKYLSPGSESGEPGVYILNRAGKDVCYSHHGESDPLSNQNNNGHSLDVFDVLCKLQYGGDVTRAIRELAPQVDPEGQKERQKEHMEQEAAGDQGVTIDPSQTAARAEQILKDRAAPAQFDIRNLPKDIRKYVSDLCERTDTDPIVITMSVLNSISAILGTRGYIPDGEYFNNLYGNIWTLVQDNSGSFKTTGLNKGSRMIWQQVDNIQSKIDILKAEKKDLPDGDARFEQIEEHIELLQYDSPVMPNKASAEGLLQLMSHGREGAILCSEFGEWLANMSKNHNAGLKALFTELYDVPKQYSYMTKGGGDLVTKRPYIAIMALSTPKWVHENINLGDVGTGFFARFLLFSPPEKRKIPPALPKYIEPIDTTFEQKALYNLNTINDRAFHLTPEARTTFKQIHQGIYEGIAKQCTKEEQVLLDPYTKRWSPYVLKLAMLFQILDDPAAEIGLAAIYPAAAIVEYAMESTIYLFKGDLGLSPFQRDCEAVLKFIAQKGGTVTRQTLLSSKKLGGGAREYDDVLTMLGDGGKIRIQHSPKGVKKDEQITVL